ncbi:glycerophosphoryl diester phosphodiesterase [Paenibacillus sp. DS2015]|uniref:glycerophosphodiester phosphodiesterase n=1 Tax=Paenibacillus sp. DS2015 TaxID=3373917 RepID=UPI003D1FE0CA
MNNPCVAHRGFSGKAPENTLVAITLAMEEPYVQWIEIDVQLSSDGVPVVIHDFTLERTTNGRGNVRDQTWSILKQLDAGRWKGKAFEGERIPSLDEVLKLTCGRLHLNIELKTMGNMYPGLEQAVMDLITYYKMESDVVLTSFEVESLRKVKAINPSFRTGLIINRRPLDLVKQLLDLDCSYLSIGASHLDSGLASLLVSKGISVMAWTIDKAMGMKRIASIHPEIMICTNRPDVWNKTMKPRKYFWQ